AFCLSSRRRHTRSKRDWSSDVCSSDLWQQRLPFRFSATLDDSGSKATGRYQATGTLSLDHPLELNDLLYASIGRSVFNANGKGRSEERRVGKGCRDSVAQKESNTEHTN